MRQPLSSNHKCSGSHKSRVKGHFWWIILLCVLAVPLLLGGCAAILFRNCGRDIIHHRQQPVNAAPILDMAIPADLGLPTQDIQYWSGSYPIGEVGTKIFLQRCESVADAGSTFEYLCDNGWADDEWNSQYGGFVILGGEGDRRYCASPAVEWRYDVSSLCALSGEYESYVILQNEDVVIAIYEMTRNGDEIGALTNEAIQEIGDVWSGTLQMNAKSRLVWEIVTFGAMERDLGGADLSEVNLSGARLGGVNLSEANLSKANLSSAWLGGANLSRANLRGANLRMADLSGANLTEADLTYADLSGADLSGADLTRASVTDEQLVQAASLAGAVMPDGTQHE